MVSSCSLPLLFTLVTSLLNPTIPSPSSSFSSFGRYTYTSLVFRGCADRKFPDPARPYTRNLRSLLTSLVSQAYEKPYSNATSGEGDHTLIGLYQCRGDLDSARCGDCVRRIPPLAVRLCGISIAARIQLGGCYSRYAVVGFRQDDDTDVLYEICGKDKAEGGFGDKRDTALGMVKNGASDGEGFYVGAYENIYVLVQCEGDIMDGSGDCSSCLGSAVERAKSVCGDSISGQVYFSKCYISYRYYPDGVPLSASSGTRGGGSRHQGSQKTVAVVFGSLAASGLGTACLVFAISHYKRREVFLLRPNRSFVNDTARN